MRKFLGLVSLAALAAGIGCAAEAASPPLILQHPSLSQTQIAFDYAGEIWTVAREGGQAQRIVTGQEMNSHPIFSPDGRWIAYTGRYDGNTDIYVVPAAGGEPRRLTWHPGADTALGWTPDGRSVIFRSQRKTFRDLEQFYVVPVEGGAPTEIPLPSGDEASLSPDGTHLAYTPHNQWQPAWKHYRGGQTMPIWIADLSDSRIVKIPRENSNDKNPMWVGDTIYFLSDRDGPVSIWAYDVKTQAVRPVVQNPKGFDIASAQAGPGGIVYDQFSDLKLFDTASGTTHTVPVTINADLPQVRAHFAPVKPPQIQHAAITASGKRVLIEAHGEILSAPAEKGDVRNLTQSPGVADRDPAASPDGKHVAWFSDESGEYQLFIGSGDGLGPVRKISLDQGGSYYYSPRWSPDSKHIVFNDKRLNLWMVDVDKGAPVRIDADRYDSPWFNLDPAWSPDSRWLVYSKTLANHMHAAFVYSLDTGKTTQLTDGLSNVTSARFDRTGDYLYFAASTSLGRGAGWLDMSSLGRASDGAVYAMVLRKNLPSPMAPESDEEASEAPKSGAVAEAKPAPKGKEAGKAAAKEAPKTKPVSIDFDHIDQRIVALPIERANITGLETGAAGVVFTMASPSALTDEDMLEAQSNPPETVSRFDLKSRKNVKFAEGVDAGSFEVSADGTKVLWAQQGNLFLTGAEAPPKPGEGKLKLDGVSVWVDPRAEWRQMYREAWRIERDFLYDPKLHGLNLARAEQVYAPFVEGIGGREDLNVLFQEMTGHIGVGHTFVRGGAMPEQAMVPTGLLGADYEVVGDRYRISKIYRGENWNPHLVSPLSQPGVNVSEGEFLLAVNGHDVRTDNEVYRAFVGLAGKQTVITVGPKADGTGSREVTIVPIPSETNLRLRSRMEANREKVDQLSGGRIAYVYVPDTGSGGFANFNRYYYAQVGKQGAIIDERFNHGGSIADSMIEELKRTPQMINSTREGAETIEPAQAIFGPKVMIINEMSGSGGDAFPWLFAKNQVGPLVGHRTWGGLVGIGGYPPLIDGGTITAPRWAIYGLKGEWEVEGVGIPPDVEVEQDPALIRQGHDPQLEAAVAVALKALEASPPPTFVRPSPPDKKPILPDGTQ